MQKSYNAFGLIHAGEGEMRCSMFSFSEAGEMMKVMRTIAITQSVNFVAAVAFDIIPGKQPTFKVGFLNNPEGAPANARAIGMPAFLGKCAGELASLIDAQK